MISLFKLERRSFRAFPPIFGNRIFHILISVLILWLIAFWDGIRSALSLWYSDTTFNHCFFVIPCAIYFGYRNWNRLDLDTVKPDLLAVIVIVGLILLWALGYAASIQLFIHIATFLILPSLIWLSIGRENALTLWFPLTFVAFCIPVGSELIEPFQEITADMAVYFLKVVGIPIYRSGLYIEVPNGKFEVAEACAGVRFFIASVCFGYFYAFVSYTKLYKRILFVAVSMALPILANGMRVFGTIMVGEKIGMEYAAGADHLVYGWLFFAIVLLLLIWIGSYWVDSPVNVEAKESNSAGLTKISLWVLSPLIVVIVWKVIIDQAAVTEGPLLSTNNIRLYEEELQSSFWQPSFKGQKEELFGRSVTSDIQVFIAAYNTDQPGAELISFSNRLYRQGVWTIDSEKAIVLNSMGLQVNAKVLDLRSATGIHRLVVYWYKLPGYEGASRIRVKFQQAFHRIMGTQLPSAVLIASGEYSPVLQGGYKNIIGKIEELIPELQDVTLRLD